MNRKLVNQKQGSIGIIKICYLLAMLNLSVSFDILIVQNDKNKSSQIWAEDIKNNFESVIDWHSCNYSAISEYINVYPDLLIILDLSDDFEVQLGLSQLCKEHKKIHLISQRKFEYKYYDEWTYSILPSSSALINAYLSVLTDFNWTQGLVITDEESIYAKQKILDYSDKFSYLTVESSANIENLVNRVIKPLGVTLYYIFANSVLSLKIQNVLKSKKLLLNGDGLILNQNSGYGSSSDGAIIITIAGQEYANSQEEFLFNSTQNLLQYLVNNTVEPAKAEELRHLLKKYNERDQFSIVNIKESKREVVGSIFNGTVTIFKKILFPGDSYDVPRSDKKILHVTASGGSYNPGTPPMTSVPLIFYGAYTAWSLINDGLLGILKNFQINYFTFDCGVSNYDEKFATACFTKDIDKFGLAHISAVSSLMAMAEMKLFKSLNLTIPVVGAMPSDDSLSSTTLYPIFTRLIISSRYMLSLTSLLFKALGWTKICFLYYNNTASISAYSVFIKSAEQYGLEILNPESSRMISAESNRANLKKIC